MFWRLLSLAVLARSGERCGDSSNLCYAWSLEGLCAESDYYRTSCPLSCGLCTPHSCSAANASEDFCSQEEDAEHAAAGGMHCSFWNLLEDRGALDLYFVHPEPDTDDVHVGRLEPGGAMGLNTYPDHVFRLVDPGRDETVATVRMFQDRDVIAFDNDYMDAIAECADTPPNTWESNCSYEASLGGCVENPGWMAVFCAMSCHSCHLRHTELRCTRQLLNMSQEPALRPGDMDEMFAGLASRAAAYKPTVLSTSPWIVTLDNFISDEEIDGLLSVASTFERSADQGEKNPFGMTEGLISKYRTSQTAWCDEECKGAPVFHRVRDRISEMIGVPWRNFETMQFLKYNVGEEYARHHDMHNLTDNHFASGPRIYTFFLYMSDVEEGGETQFTELNISVRPRKGSALLWPSVKSQNPTVQDERTMHAARPVRMGSKVAANVWVHLFDFEVSSIWACTGGLRDVR